MVTMNDRGLNFDHKVIIELVAEQEKVFCRPAPGLLHNCEPDTGCCIGPALRYLSSHLYRVSIGFSMHIQNLRDAEIKRHSIQ
jgi:hypothetical protein